MKLQSPLIVFNRGTQQSPSTSHYFATTKMCGIHAVISPNQNYTISDDFKRCLCSRGPDHTATVQSQVTFSDATASSLFLNFTSTVLALRGDHVAKQPLVDESPGSVLCWNGEAWRIQGELVRGNDGEAVLALLSKASKVNSNGDSVLEALRSIEGPFAFIYLDKPARRLYYGRDRLGRRSLLVKPGMPFSLSSIAEMPVDGWSEVEADGCYSLQLDQDNAGAGLEPVRHDWTSNSALVSDEFDTRFWIESLLLTLLGLKYWCIQHENSITTLPALPRFSIGLGFAPVSCRVIKASSSGRADSTKGLTDRCQSCCTLLWRLRLYRTGTTDPRCLAFRPGY